MLNKKDFFDLNLFQLTIFPSHFPFIIWSTKYPHFIQSLREAAKKGSYLVAWPLRPYPPPPSSLVATFFGDFLLELQKKFFFS